MKKLLACIFLLVLIVSCQSRVDKNKLKQEVYRTEKAFEKMVADSNVAIAFYSFADSNAVILRGNDSIIKGKEGIRNFYEHKVRQNATVNWTPDFIDVSNDGTLAYTYGKYRWKFRQADGTIKESKGIFHTVWKKQADGSWKYVWD